jgi:spore maturation protein CgeB
MKKGDQHNSRTFQIAACGGAIMLAQRTDEHTWFFEEDKEALFFGDMPELKSKLAEWLDPKRDNDRRRMAEAARARCIKENYTYDPVADSFLRHFGLPSTLNKAKP